MSDRAMEALIEAAAGHGMHRPTAEQLRFVHILHHGRAPSLATFRQRLARFRAPPPRAAFAGAGAVGFVRPAGGAQADGPA